MTDITALEPTRNRPGRKPKAAFDPAEAIRADAQAELDRIDAELAVARSKETIAHNRVAALEAARKVAEKNASNGH